MSFPSILRALLAPVLTSGWIGCSDSSTSHELQTCEDDYAACKSQGCDDDCAETVNACKESVNECACG
jgi:hypothetical protein